MPIVARCSCQKAFKVPDKFAGKAVKCPGCGQPVSVGAAAAGASGGIPASIKISCTTCQKIFSAPEKLKGKRVKCPNCQEVVVVQESPFNSAAPTSPPPSPVQQKSPLPASPKAKGKKASSGGCPQCKKPLVPEAVICTHCGFNLKTGKNVGRTTTDEEVSDSEMTAFIVGGILLLALVVGLIYYFLF